MKDLDLSNVLVFDVETTGLPEKGQKWDTDFELFPQIVQLSWVFGEKVRDYIIKPINYEIPTKTTKIHGITTELAKEKGVYIWEALFELIRDAERAEMIIGHNVHFDTSIVKANVLRYLGRLFYDTVVDGAFDKSKRICTMLKSIKWVGAKFEDGKKGKFPNLSELYAKCFNGATFDAHNSLNDVKAVIECLPVLIEAGVIDLTPKNATEFDVPKGDELFQADRQKTNLLEDDNF